MLKSHYIEDVFINFYHLVISSAINVQWQDSTPVSSFANVIVSNKNLTQAQSKYILKILTKYKILSKMAGLDYESCLEDPKWKGQFRTVDTARRVHIETDSNGSYVVCLKFPFDFKKTFDLEFSSLLDGISSASWDAERKLRLVPLYKINVVSLHEFVKAHNFEIDDSFLDTVFYTEEIWSQQDDIIPYSCIEQDSVVINNAPGDAVAWWQAHKTGNVKDDLMFAKCMHYFLKIDCAETHIEKIASSSENIFWMKTLDAFFNLYKDISTGKICIILDRSSDVEKWVKDFVYTSQQHNIPQDDIKVCFRRNNSEKTSFNDWIKENNLGGSVESGRIFIFENKPPKWLFSKAIDIKIIATNGVYPNTNITTQSWLESHHCVVHISEMKPSQKRNNKIVEL